MENGALSKLISFFETFTELDASNNCGVIAGFGVLNGANMFLFAENGEGVSKLSADKISKLYQNAVKAGAPVIGIYNSKGGCIKDGRNLLNAYGEIASMSAELSGVVPQISIINGVCAGASALIACMADFVITTEKSELFIAPPFLSENKDETSGTSKNAALSGTASIVVKDEEEAVEVALKLINLLPYNNLDTAVFEAENNELTEINPNKNGEFSALTLIDKNTSIEISKDFGNIFTGFGNIGGFAVGLIEVNSRLTSADCAKIIKFVSFCDAFSIPLITAINSEGFELDSKSELNGSIRYASKLAQTYACATTAKINLITGSAIGNAYIALASSGDFTISFENAIIEPISEKAAQTFMDGKYTSGDANLSDLITSPENARNAVISALNLLKTKRGSKIAASPNRKHIV